MHNTPQVGVGGQQMASLRVLITGSFKPDKRRFISIEPALKQKERQKQDDEEEVEQEEEEKRSAAGHAGNMCSWPTLTTGKELAKLRQGRRATALHHHAAAISAISRSFLPSPLIM